MLNAASERFQAPHFLRASIIGGVNFKDLSNLNTFKHQSWYNIENIQAKQCDIYMFIQTASHRVKPGIDVGAYSIPAPSLKSLWFAGLWWNSQECGD